MPTYILRDLEPGAWNRFKERAHREGWPLRALVLQLMADYAAGKVTLSTGPGPRPTAGFSMLTCQNLQCPAGGRPQQVRTQKDQVPAILKARGVPCPACRALIRLSPQELEHMESWLHTSDPKPGEFGD